MNMNNSVLFNTHDSLYSTPFYVPFRTRGMSFTILTIILLSMNKCYICIYYDYYDYDYYIPFLHLLPTLPDSYTIFVRSISSSSSLPSLSIILHQHTPSPQAVMINAFSSRSKSPWKSTSHTQLGWAISWKREDRCHTRIRSSSDDANVSPFPAFFTRRMKGYFSSFYISSNSDSMEIKMQCTLGGVSHNSRQFPFKS